MHLHAIQTPVFCRQRGRVDGDWPKPLWEVLDRAPFEIEPDRPDHVRCGDHVHAAGQGFDHVDAQVLR